MSQERRLTRNQSLVLDALCASAIPMSAYAILERLRTDGLRAPLQVYRALDKLVDAGLAHRLESLNAFVACARPHCHKAGVVAFAICDTCHRVTEFSDDVVRARLESWSEREGFTPSSTAMEMRGSCRLCQATQ